jgi:catalase
MPLPSDEHIVNLSQELIAQFDAIFGLHPGFRPAHAKGILLSGTFTPAREAKTLTKAPHIAREWTPVSVRFSNSTGVPLIPDNDPNANPRGMAIRFHLGEHVHTDIVSHSTDGFPTRTGAEFLEFLRALAASSATQESPSPIEQFLASHPAALAFVQTPKPMPVSFAKETYFGVTAFEFMNAQGESCFGRYRILPDAGSGHFDAEGAKRLGGNFLFDEIAERVAAGPVSFSVQVQVAEAGDVVDDATIHWPEERAMIPFGQVVLTEVVGEQHAEQKRIIFDPIPRVEGIDASGDPLLELRAAVYLLSGRRRRQVGA